MPWRYIDPYIERLSRHTTIYGKYWLCFVTVFRLTVLPFAESCWSDEQKEFKCNTQEIGCNNVCFNQFAPINQDSFELNLFSLTISGQIVKIANNSFVFTMCSKQVKVRLWSIQLLAITAPLALYSVFVFHMLDKRKEKERRQKNDEMLQSPYKVATHLMPINSFLKVQFHGAENLRHRINHDPIPVIGCPGT